MDTSGRMSVPSKPDGCIAWPHFRLRSAVIFTDSKTIFILAVSWLVDRQLPFPFGELRQSERNCDSNRFNCILCQR